MRDRVMVTRRFDADALDPLMDACEVRYCDEDAGLPRGDLLDAVAEVKGLVCTVTDRIDGELLDRAPKLKVVSTVSVGYDHLDIKAATARGVLLTNTPDVLTETTADLTFGLILAAARRIVEGDRLLREGRSTQSNFMGFLGQDVHGKVLGILGLGRIGCAVARRAKGFQMRVLYHNPRRLPDEREDELGVTWVDRDSLLRESDYLSLHVPLNPETRHCISTTELSKMKPTAILINASRGPVVDEEALLSALESGRIAGAGLDVYDREPQVTPGLLGIPQAVLTPHVGSATVETRRKMTERAVYNCLEALQGRWPPDLLNPEVMGT